MDYQNAIQFIFGRLNYERSPGLAKSLGDFRLARMQRLLTELGNPQRKVPTVHIAGSKGKGSTSTMVARILEQAGYRVGLFTSPHVTNYEERFTVNTKRPSQMQIVAYVERIRPIVEEMDQSFSQRGPTFFEISTAIGWLHFLSEEVDLAVIEVGLGGRLDSTNLCQPLVSAITSISRDHTHLLGDTEELIAREKAGIIKTGVPVVSGVTASGPAEIIQTVAKESGAPVYQLNQDFRCCSRVITPSPYREPPRYEFDYSANNTEQFPPLSQLELAMSGEHQIRNASLAVTMIHLLKQRGFLVDEQALRRGLLQAKCPLRIEVISYAPLLIIDAAHNAASIKALCSTLEEIQASQKLAVVAFSKDKDVPEMLQLLNQHFDEFYLTRYDNPRAIGFEDLSHMANKTLTKPWKFFENSSAALLAAQSQADPDDLICITGSFFLAAEMQDQLLPA